MPGTQGKPSFLYCHRPHPLQWQFGLPVFIKVVIMSKQLFQQILLRPQPHPEEAFRKFFLRVAFEAAPRDEQPFTCAKLGDRP